MREDKNGLTKGKIQSLRNWAFSISDEISAYITGYWQFFGKISSKVMDGPLVTGRGIYSN